MLSGKRIALGVTGGIAAYRAAELISLLKKEGAEVRAVMTEHACQFIAPMTLATLSGNPVHTDLFAARDEIAHIALAKWADLFVVAPATANALAKFAGGVADDLLSTTYPGHALPCAAGAGDERRHVETPRHAEKRRTPARLGRALLRPRPRAPRLRRRGRGPHGGAAGHPAAPSKKSSAKNRTSPVAACSSPPAPRARCSTPCAF